MTTKPRSLGFHLARHGILLAAAAIFLSPFAWMLLTSLKVPEEIFAADWHWLPRRLALVENYGEAFLRQPLLRYLANGMLVCLAIFALQLLVNIPFAYALAKIPFRGRSVVFRMVLGVLLIPIHVTAIPLYILFNQLGLLNSYAALIVPFVGSAFGTFLLRQHFMTVPDDLIHAARLDGMSEWSIIWRIMVPSAVPAISAFFIFSFVAHWNAYFWPLLVVTIPEIATPPLGVMFFRTEAAGSIQYGPLMAAAVIITAPIALAFLIAQRRFIEGMTLTGMKA
ncbi:MAG: carbohydrate ABC transporter permease [Rhodospirillales bacterium]|nr:carbohydrate ABC transporter permease [Rhodospirillales bacterium]